MNEENLYRLLRKIKNYITPGTTALREMLRLQTHGGITKGCDFVVNSIVETVTLTAAGSVNLTNTLPNGARVLAAHRLNVTLVSLTTAVKLGLGTAASPSKYLLTSTSMAINEATGLAANADAQVAAPALTTGGADTLVLSTVDTGGAAAGSGTGTVMVRIVYAVAGPLLA